MRRKYFLTNANLVIRATVVQQFQITEKKEKVAVAGCRVRVVKNRFAI